MKFKDLVNEEICQDELMQVYGGHAADPNEQSACDTQACSSSVESIKNLCDSGVCRSQAI